MTDQMLWQLALLTVPGLAIGLWWTGSRAHELAVAHARAACSRESLQLLDDTVALFQVRLVRSAQGSLALQRRYRFEFTSSGEYRDVAELTLCGQELRQIRFPYRRDAQGRRIFQH